MKRDEITSNEFNEIKKGLIENDLLSYQTLLGLIKVEPDSFEKRYLKVIVEGKETKLNAEKTVLNKLFEIAGISRKVIVKKLSADLIASLIRAINSASANSPVTLLIDHNSRTIVNIMETGHGRLSNKLLLATTEMLLNDNPDMKLVGISGDGYDFSIKLLAGQINDMGITGEGHDFGLVLSNTGKGTSISDYAYRLVCSNGMMGIRTDERLKLSGSSEADIKMLYDTISEMKRNNFIPLDFDLTIKNAIGTPASYRELENAAKIVTSRIIHEDDMMRQQLVSGVIASHFPHLLKVQNRIKSKGYDLDMLNQYQKAKIRTDINLWDVINEVTWIGSHKTTFDIMHRDELQREIMKVVKKNPDHLDSEYYFV